MSAAAPGIEARLAEARRQGCVATARAYELAGISLTAAVAFSAAIFNVHPRTVWTWMEDK